MQERLYRRPLSDHITGEAHSPSRRAERLSRLYDDLVARFGAAYPMAVRVKAQLDAARTLAGQDDEVQP